MGVSRSLARDIFGDNGHQNSVIQHIRLTASIQSAHSYVQLNKKKSRWR